MFELIPPHKATVPQHITATYRSFSRQRLQASPLLTTSRYALQTIPSTPSLLPLQIPSPSIQAGTRIQLPDVVDIHNINEFALLLLLFYIGGRALFILRHFWLGVFLSLALRLGKDPQLDLHTSHSPLFASTTRQIPTFFVA